MQNPEDFLKTFDTSMRYLKAGSRGSVSRTGVEHTGSFSTSHSGEWLRGKPRGSCSGGRVRFLGFSTHATTDIILDTIATDEFDTSISIGICHHLKLGRPSRPPAT